MADVGAVQHSGELHELDDVRAQRAGVHRSMTRLEEAAAAPLVGRPEAWSREAGRSVAWLAASWERHIGVTEGPGGLFAQIREDSPQLAPRLARLHRDHQELHSLLARIQDALDQHQDDAAALQADREVMVDLLARLARHRQQGADLIYEAYSVDVGAGD